MKDIKSWLFILIALMWLLPEVSISTGSWGIWVQIVALAAIGALGLKK